MNAWTIAAGFCFSWAVGASYLAYAWKHESDGWEELVDIWREMYNERAGTNW